MSVASSMIECSKCNYRSSMSVVHGIFNYTSNGDEHNVLRNYGWCFECENFVAIERFDTEEAIKIGIINAKEKIKFVEEAGFWTRMKSEYKRLKRDYNFNLKHIKELEWKIDHIKNRKSPPKCLVCGGTNNKRIDVKDLDYYNPGPDKEIVGFKHPNCDGELWLIRCSLMFNVRFEPKFYDLEGNRL